MSITNLPVETSWQVSIPIKLLEPKEPFRRRYTCALLYSCYLCSHPLYMAIWHACFWNA
jgi:hypothetical protein